MCSATHQYFCGGLWIEHSRIMCAGKSENTERFFCQRLSHLGGQITHPICGSLSDIDITLVAMGQSSNARSAVVKTIRNGINFRKIGGKYYLSIKYVPHVCVTQVACQWSDVGIALGS